MNIILKSSNGEHIETVSEPTTEAEKKALYDWMYSKSDVYDTAEIVHDAGFTGDFDDLTAVQEIDLKSRTTRKYYRRDDK